MAIALDAFRNLAATGDVTLRQNGAEIRETRFMDRVRLFFNAGNARLQNSALLNEFKEALRNETRYKLHLDEIDRLVDSIRTDRAIGAAQIHSVISQLDGMTNSRMKLVRAFDARVDQHLAMRGIPDRFKGIPEDKFMDGLRLSIRGNVRDLSAIDISIGIQDYFDLVDGAMTDLGRDEDLRFVFQKAFGEIVISSGSRTVRPPNEIKERVTNIRDCLNIVRDNPGAYGGGVTDDMRNYLALGKAPAAAKLAEKLPVALSSLGPAMQALDLTQGFASVPELLTALRSVAANLMHHVLDVFPQGADEQGTLQELFANLAVRGLPDETKNRLVGFMTSDAGMQFRKLIACSQATKNGPEMPVVASLMSAICSKAGLPMVNPDDVEQPLEHLADMGLTRSDLYDVAPNFLSKAEKKAEESLRARVDYLRAFPALSATPEGREYGFSVLDAFNAVMQPPFVSERNQPVRKGELMREHLDFIKGVLFAELAELPAEGRPTGEELKAFLRNHPLVRMDLSRSDGAGGILDYVEYAFRLRQMNTEQRATCLELIRQFEMQTHGDEFFMLRFGQNVDALVNLRRAGNLTWQNAFSILTGGKAPSETGDAPGMQWMAYANGRTNAIDDLLSQGKLLPDQYVAMVALVKSEGLELEDALKVVKGECGMPKQKPDPFRTEVVFKVNATVSEVSQALAVDLPRMNNDYVVGGKPAHVAPGGNYLFKNVSGQGNDDAVSTEVWLRNASEGNKAKFLNGKPTGLSDRLKENVIKMCGRQNVEQCKLVLTALGQNSLLPLRSLSSLYGVSADEHSPASWTVERRENGDVAVTVSQPPNCPVEFSWTFVFDAQGRQRMEGEPVLRKVE